MPYNKDGIGYQKTDNSKAAAYSNYPGKLTAKDRVLQLLQKVPNKLTTEEISDVLQIPYGTVQPRLSELQNENKVVDSGLRGKTKWGKSCIRWEAV